jgi:prepilin-type N-terminal cleavage/methylation domain-containing protein
MPGGLRGHTLIELLCVIVIIAILMSMLLPTIIRVYSRVKRLEAEDIASSLEGGIRHYCDANPGFSFSNKTDLIFKCKLEIRCQDWVNRNNTLFVPFDYLSPTNETVIAVYFHSGRYSATYAYTKGQLAPVR